MHSLARIAPCSSSFLLAPNDHPSEQHSKLHESYEETDVLKNLPKSVSKDLVLLSQSAMQLCELCIGDPAMVVTREGILTVKTVWPIQEGNLTSVFMTREGLDMSCIPHSTQVILKKLGSLPTPAKEIEIIPSNQNLDIPESLIHHQLLGSILSKDYKFKIPYYGKVQTFEVKNVKPMSSYEMKPVAEQALEKKMNDLNIFESSGDNEPILEKFFKVVQGTRWINSLKSRNRSSEDKSYRKMNRLSQIGGLEEVIEDLQQLLLLVFQKGTQVHGIKNTHGILLYGPPGVGKTMLAEAIAAESKCCIFHVHGAELFSRFVGEAEEKLRKIFEDAVLSAPSLILLDEIDALCPRRNSSSLEQERRIVATLATQLDGLGDTAVVIIATTCRPDSIDSALRRPGREIEITVPTPGARVHILHKLLSTTTHSLNESDIKGIAQAAHGFVGADLAALCSQAAHHALASRRTINLPDMQWALTQVKPSAMREALVHIPNVRWTDVGGQRALKLQLRQAVEWPLKHPEAFQRLGIKPPRGVLLFGPPGCSKTLVAKALATESKLNFISIKGPELFSKWVGESERAVREVFRRARQVAPAIVFLDELDALGGERAGVGGTSGSSVQERVVAQLLTELDGVEPLGDVTILAATNRPDRVDKALLRPGRLDRVVYVPLPDCETRADILSIQLQHMPVANDVDIDELARCTEGYSGAELVAVCHEAALAALEQDLEAVAVNKDNFNAALNIVTPRTQPSLLQLYERYLSNTS
ncbi:Spermatogenesis-associated protein 5 [Gryllus bimaculatus]|nr:Spermatogenesis-associated protein 5 [Gryllus bimaculatus]